MRQALALAARAYFCMRAGIVDWLRHALRRRRRHDDDVGRRKKVAALISRPQDVELLAGLHERALDRTDIDCDVWVLATCIKRDSDIIAQLTARGMTPAHIVRLSSLRRVWRDMRTLDAFINTRESRGRKYRHSDFLTDMANGALVHTYTLQHGFENPGLTYHDDHQGTGITFAAKTVLIWGRPEQLPAWLPVETRRKCISTGCPKVFATPQTPEATHDVQAAFATRVDSRPVIAVFENLQWRRFDADYVCAFLMALGEVARERTDLRFVLKSHPGAAKNRTEANAALLRQLEADGFVQVIDLFPPELPRLTSAQLLSIAKGAITSPSTIALDAALAGVPVAVTRYGLDLTPYRPLTLLDSTDDWRRFVDALSDVPARAELDRCNAAFVDGALVPGDASARILDLVAAQGAAVDTLAEPVRIRMQAAPPASAAHHEALRKASTSSHTTWPSPTRSRKSTSSSTPD